MAYRIPGYAFRVIKLLYHYAGGLMNRLFQVLVLICAVLFIGVGVASADTMQFTLSGPVSASFDLSSTPSIMMGNSDPGFGFMVAPVNLMVNGSAAPGDFLAFYNSSVLGGGMGIFVSGTERTVLGLGAQIYGGTETNPTFAPGTFTLADANVVPSVPGAYTLTVTDLTTVSTPEPSVTILLAIGLVAFGLVVIGFKPNFGVSAS
jgi:hypothetical protein